MKKIFSYILVFINVILINSHVFFWGYIPSESMEPTFTPGDFILGTRFDKDDINRYDIITFKYPDDETKIFIKRVIGLPGEKIEIIDGIVYANGEKLDDSFVKELSEDSGMYEVPEGCYFMLGDNRRCSLDSRYWINTYVRSDQIVAKEKCKIWSSIPELLEAD